MPKSKKHPDDVVRDSGSPFPTTSVPYWVREGVDERPPWALGVEDWRKWEKVFQLIAEGKTNDEACKEIGMRYSWLYAIGMKLPTFKARHRAAMDERAAKIEDALVSSAIGTATETRTTVDDDGATTTTTIKLAPSVAAQKLWLQSRKPEEYAPKPDMIADNRSIIVMPAVRVGGAVLDMQVGEPAEVKDV